MPPLAAQLVVATPLEGVVVALDGLPAFVTARSALPDDLVGASILASDGRRRPVTARAPIPLDGAEAGRAWSDLAAFRIEGRDVAVHEVATECPPADAAVVLAVAGGWVEGRVARCTVGGLTVATDRAIPPGAGVFDAAGRVLGLVVADGDATDGEAVAMSPPVLSARLARREVPVDPCSDLVDTAGEVVVGLDDEGRVCVEGRAFGPETFAGPLADALSAKATGPHAPTVTVAVAPGTSSGLTRRVLAELRANSAPVELVGEGAAIPLGRWGDLGVADRAVGRPPLVVHLGAESAEVGRDGTRLSLALPPGAERQRLVDGLVSLDRRLHPGEAVAIVDSDDDVPYDEALAVVERVRGSGFQVVGLRGGPPIARPEPPILAGTGPVRAPSIVEVAPNGAFRVDQELVSLGDIRIFVEDCAAACALALQTAAGDRIAIGTRPVTDSPLDAWIFGRPVVRVPGALAGVRPPRRVGELLPLPELDGPQLQAVPVSQRVVLLGRVDDGAFEVAMRAAEPAVRACYADTDAGRGPAKVVLRYELSPDGPARVSATSTMGLEPLAGCLDAAAAAASFPAPEGGGVSGYDVLRFPPLAP